MQKKAIIEFLADNGRKRWEGIGDAERSEILTNAIKARWGKRPRCACGEMTLKRAKARGHRCTT